MADNNTSAPTGEGGSGWEITAAADALTSSWLAWTSDPANAALKDIYHEAARRHQAAVSGSAQTGMAAIAVPLYEGIGRLEAGLKRLEDTWENRFDYMLGIIDTHLKAMDARLDAYGNEISTQGDKIDGLVEDVSTIKGRVEVVERRQVTQETFNQGSLDHRTRLERAISGLQDTVNQLPQSEQLQVIKEVLARLDAVEENDRQAARRDIAILISQWAVVLVFVVIIVLSVTR